MTTRDGQDDAITHGAMIALPVPGGTAARLAQPGGLPPSDLHVTLAYLGDARQLTADQLRGVHEAALETANAQHPVSGTCPAASGTFNNPEEQPYWFDPGCPGIHGLREALVRSLAARGLDHLIASNHPFTPHITIAYLSPDEAPPPDSQVPNPAPVTFTHLEVVLGDELPTLYPLRGADSRLPLAAASRPRVRITSQTDLALRRMVELHNRAAHLGHRATPEMARAVYSRSGSTSRVRDFLRALSSRSPHPDDDLFPAPHPRTPLAETLDLAAELQADDVSTLLAAAAAYPLTDPRHSLHLSRALARAQATGQPLLAERIRPLLADGNSSVARSLRAKRQLRDRFGKWIEMGGGVRFKIKSPGAPGGGTWYHGKVEGVDVPNGRVDVRLEDGRLVKVPADKVEQPKAIIGLKSPGGAPVKDDPSAPVIDKLEETDTPTITHETPATLAELQLGAEDASEQLFKRIPESSTARPDAAKVADSVDKALEDLQDGVTTPQQTIKQLRQLAEFSDARAQDPSFAPSERDAFRAYSEDVLDVSTGIDPNLSYQGQSLTDTKAAVQDPNAKLRSLSNYLQDLAGEHNQGGLLHDKLASLSNVFENLTGKDVTPEKRAETLKAVDGFIDQVLNDHLDELGPDGEARLQDVQDEIPDLLKPASSAPQKPAPSAKPNTSEPPKKPVLKGVSVGSTVVSGVITGEERHAFEKYTGNGFKPMNTYLRTGELPAVASDKPWNKVWENPKFVEEQNKQLSSLIDRSQLAHDLTTWRGTGDTDFLASLQVGSVITDKGFVSTSSNKDVADAFASTAMFEITLPAGTHAVDVDGMNHYLDQLDGSGDDSLFGEEAESEILLPAGTSFKVTAIEDLGGFKNVKMELTNEKEAPADVTAPGTTAEPGGAPAGVPGADVVDGGSGGNLDLHGNPVPSFAKLSGERQLAGKTVQDYVVAPTAPGAKDGYTVVAGVAGGKPVYVVRQSFGAHMPVGNRSSWDDVKKTIDADRANHAPAPAAPTPKPDPIAEAKAAHEEHLKSNTDDANRPLPEGWSRDLTPEGQTVYVGPGRYRAVNGEGQGDLALLARVENGSFALVGDYPDWPELQAGLEKDQVARAQDHREQFATWMEGHGFSSGFVDAVRKMSDAEQVKETVKQDPAYQKIQKKGQDAAYADFQSPEEKAAAKAMSELNSFMKGVQPIPEQPQPTSAAKESLSPGADMIVDEFLVTALPEIQNAINAFRDNGDASLLQGLDPSIKADLTENIRDYMDAGFPLGPATKDDLEKFLSELDAAMSGTELPDVSTPDAPAAKDDGTPVDMSSWTQLDPATYQAPDGTQYRATNPKSADHARSEVLAANLYQLAGVTTHPVQLGETAAGSGDLRVLTPVTDLQGSTADLKNKLGDQAYLSKIQSGFAIDAWLANWDTVGTSLENLVTGPDGDPRRSQTNGALMYRALGQPKGALFGTQVNELNTMRSSDKAPQAAQVFGSMSDADVKESAKRLLPITDEQIADAVSKTGFDAATADALTKKLITRRHDVLDNVGLSSNSPVANTITALKNEDTKKHDPAVQPAAVGKVRIAADGVTQLEIGMKVVSTKDGTTGVVHKHDPSDKYVKIKRDSDGKVIARATKTLMPVGVAAPAAPVKQAEAPKKELPFPQKKKAVAKKSVVMPKLAPTTMDGTPVGVEYMDGDEAHYGDLVKVPSLGDGELYQVVGYDASKPYTSVKLKNTSTGLLIWEDPEELQLDTPYQQEKPSAPSAEPKPAPAAPSEPKYSGGDPVMIGDEVYLDGDPFTWEVVSIDPSKPNQPIQVSNAEDNATTWINASEMTPASGPSMEDWEQELLDAFEPATPPEQPLNPAPKQTILVAGKAIKPGDIVESLGVPFKIDVNLDGDLIAVNQTTGDVGPAAVLDGLYNWPGTKDELPSVEKPQAPLGTNTGLTYVNADEPVFIGTKVNIVPNGEGTWTVVGFGGNEFGNPSLWVENTENGNKLQVTNVYKPPSAPAAPVSKPEPLTLGPGYAPLPDGATPLYQHKTTGGIIVQHAGALNGTHYGKDGATSVAWGKLENYAKNPNWTLWSGQTAAPAANAPSVPTPPLGVPSVLGADGNHIFAGVSVVHPQSGVGVVKSIEPNGKYVKVKYQSGTKAHAASKLKVSGAPTQLNKPATKSNVPTATSAPAYEAPSIAEPPKEIPEGTLDGPTQGGTASLSQAREFLAKSPENAVKGVSVATDSGDIEDLDMRMVHVKVDGQDRLLLKFKLTDWAGKNLQVRQVKEGWKNRPWKVNNWKLTPGQVPSISSTAPGVSAAGGSSSKLMTLDLPGNVHVEHRTAVGYGGPKALHNSVEITVPADADEATIRTALFAAGVTSPSNAGEQDVRSFIENRMITMLTGNSDPNQNFTGATREQHLNTIKTKYGVTAADFKVEHGASGRIEVTAPQELRDKLMAQTGLKGLGHNLTVKGSTPEARLAFLESIFTDQQGLRSTVSRWTEGVVTNGMSSSKDINTGGADYVFFSPLDYMPTEILNNGYGGGENKSWASVQIIADPRETIFKNLAWNANTHDEFGARLGGDILARTKQNIYEIMPKGKVDWDSVHTVKISEWYRKALIERLKSKGITMIGSRTLEQFFPAPGTAVTPAPGVPAPGLPDGSPAPAPAAPGAPA